MIIQQARTIAPLPGVVDGRLADAAGAQTAPRIEVLATHDRATAARRQTHAAAVVGVQRENLAIALQTIGATFRRLLYREHRIVGVIP
jgi:autotransporter translocation and assembly factor TamB